YRFAINPRRSVRDESDAGGVAEISRWCKPPVTHPKMRRAPGGATEWRRAISAAPAGARIQCSRPTGGLHHRLLMSNVSSGQVAAFPALALEIQCLLVCLRSKTSLNTYSKGEQSPSPSCLSHHEAHRCKETFPHSETLPGNG